MSLCSHYLTFSSFQFTVQYKIILISTINFLEYYKEHCLHSLLKAWEERASTSNFYPQKLAFKALVRELPFLHTLPSTPAKSWIILKIPSIFAFVFGVELFQIQLTYRLASWKILDITPFDLIKELLTLKPNNDYTLVLSFYVRLCPFCRNIQVTLISVL